MSMKNRDTIILSFNDMKVLGVFEIDFLFYLCRRLNDENFVFTTDKTLSVVFGKTVKTIAAFKRKLRDFGLIKYIPGLIMVNPECIHLNVSTNEMVDLIKRYSQFPAFLCRSQAR